jgi:hypothetical protein
MMNPDEDTIALVLLKRRIREWIGKGDSRQLAIHIYETKIPVSDEAIDRLLSWAHGIGCIADRRGDVISVARHVLFVFVLLGVAMLGGTARV